MNRCGRLSRSAALRKGPYRTGSTLPLNRQKGETNSKHPDDELTQKVQGRGDTDKNTRKKSLKIGAVNH